MNRDTDNVDEPPRDPALKLRQTFMADQHFAQLSERWPEYRRGDTSHFTEDDWHLIGVELQLKREFAARDRRRRRAQRVWSAALTVVFLLLSLLLVFWIAPVIAVR
jgi:hypothetical protein